MRGPLGDLHGGIAMEADALRQVLDIKKLHGLYTRRRTAFASQILPETHHAFSDRLALATISCDLCILTYQALQDSLLVKLKGSLQDAEAQRGSFERTMR